MKKNNTLNFYKSSILVAAFAMGFGFTSCDNDDDLVFSGKPVANAELRAALQGKGYQFNEAGNLLMDAKVAATDSLDLSGTKISDLKDLVLFPNLKYVDLSDNGYGPVYDFANLPQNIQGVDLTGNEIYDFEGLVKVETTEEGDQNVTVLRNLTSLYIPNTMKANFDDMVPYYRTNKEAINKGTMDVKMADENGKLNVYSTLRNIPDANLVTYFKHEFPEVMVGDQIDMDAHLSLDYVTKALSISAVGTGDVYEIDVLDFEGVQYFANNPNWNGTVVSLTGLANADYSPKSVMPEFPIKESVTSAFFTFVSGEINFSKASGLTGLMVTGNNGLTEIDMTGATLWGTRDQAIELSMSSASQFMIAMCPELEKITMPKAKDLKCFYYTVEVCPKLKEVDMSNLGMTGYGIILAELGDDCKLTYPTDFKLYEKDGFVETNFACSTNVWNVQATKDFLKRHYTDIEDSSKRIQKGYTMNSMDDFDWESELSK